MASRRELGHRAKDGGGGGGGRGGGERRRRAQASGPRAQQRREYALRRCVCALRPRVHACAAHAACGVQRVTRALQRVRVRVDGARPPAKRKRPEAEKLTE
eukprot:1650982-Pleurochrysis_carterae.AAC.1